MLNKLSKSEQILIFTGLILVLIVLVIIEGWFVAYLWNWLMPTIFWTYYNYSLARSRNFCLV